MTDKSSHFGQLITYLRGLGEDVTLPGSFSQLLSVTSYKPSYRNNSLIVHQAQ